MIGLGYIETFPIKDQCGNDAVTPINSDAHGFAWHTPHGCWRGWFDTQDEAMTDAPDGAHIVEKTVTQRCVGRKGDTK